MTCSIDFYSWAWNSVKTTIVTSFSEKLSDIKTQSCLIGFQWVDCLRMKTEGVLTTSVTLPVSRRKSGLIGEWTFKAQTVIISSIHTALSYVRLSSLTSSSPSQTRKYFNLHHVAGKINSRTYDSHKVLLMVFQSILCLQAKSQQMIQEWESMLFKKLPKFKQSYYSFLSNLLVILILRSTTMKAVLLMLLPSYLQRFFHWSIYIIFMSQKIQNGFGFCLPDFYFSNELFDLFSHF